MYSYVYNTVLLLYVTHASQFFFFVEFAGIAEFPFEEFSSLFNVTGGCFNDTDPPTCVQSQTDGNVIL